MHEIYLVKVPETVDLLTQTAPITIMTRSPHVGSYTLLMLVLPSITSFAKSFDTVEFSSRFSCITCIVGYQIFVCVSYDVSICFCKVKCARVSIILEIISFCFWGRPNFFNKGICLRISFLRLGLIVPGHESLIANLLVKSFIFYFLD